MCEHNASPSGQAVLLALLHRERTAQPNRTAGMTAHRKVTTNHRVNAAAVTTLWNCGLVSFADPTGYSRRYSLTDAGRALAERLAPAVGGGLGEGEPAHGKA